MRVTDPDAIRTLSMEKEVDEGKGSRSMDDYVFKSFYLPLCI